MGVKKYKRSQKPVKRRFSEGYISYFVFSVLFLPSSGHGQNYKKINIENCNPQK